MVAEEIRWSRAHTGWDAAPGDPDAVVVAAHEVTVIYRDLRKGLEDTKNEPSAGDFYYGEMEMRRLTGRERHASHAPGDDSGSTSRVERALLYAYWAASGYGLRASRALVALALVLVTSGILYTHPTFATVTPAAAQIQSVDPTTGAVTYSLPEPSAAPDFTTALEFSARESISLLQTRSTSILTTTGPGTVLDITLRLVGPVLLALAVFALRGRTKR
ncbi:hypothetical protein [Rhodococcus koreensis]